jgi:hypothetical protein
MSFPFVRITLPGRSADPRELQERSDQARKIEPDSSGEWRMAIP